MAKLADVVFDARHPASLARFWAAALDGYDVAPYDDEELARLRAKGIADPEDDPTVLVEGPPTSPRIWFQRVPEPKATKNRVHLDVRADDPDVLKTDPTAAAFGAAPLISNPRLSPNGERLVQIQMHPSGVSLARVLDIATGTVTPLIAGAGDDSPVPAEVMWCGWKNDTRLLCAVRALGTGRASIARMVGIDRDGGAERRIHAA